MNAGTYTLGAAGPPGYSGEWSCASDDVGGDDIGSDDVRAASAVAGSTVVLGSGDSVTCTLTNDDRPAHLTLITHVVNDNGGTAQPAEWTLSATGPTRISGHTGDPSVTDAEVNAGTYTLGQTGPPGYAGHWACSPDTLTGSTMVVANGADVTCTATNDDRAAHLTLVAHLVNDNGGSARPTDWTLRADGPTPVSGHTGDSAITDVEVTPRVVPANPNSWTHRLCTVGLAVSYQHPRRCPAAQSCSASVTARRALSPTTTSPRS